MELNIQNETSRLRAVVLGTAKSSGPIPTPEQAYDPKSLEHIIAGTYPKEEDMIQEMDAVCDVFKKYDVKVYRPEVIENVNQIFARDIALVIDDKIIDCNILPDRQEEIEAIRYVFDQIDRRNIVTLPNEAHIEGGDVILYNDYIFVGVCTRPDYKDLITARTNSLAVKMLRDNFPKKTIKSFELRKSNTDPRNNALHLDCCFQPVGNGKAILHKNGFFIEEEYQWLVNFFGKVNVFEITKDEMYNMKSNIFSIAPDVVISEINFDRLNTWFEEQGITVEKVPYAEVGKQGGLLRCSTMPLIRD
ncbi:MAG: arginine deiminase family protein [Bacteroidota bacterium]